MFKLLRIKKLSGRQAVVVMIVFALLLGSSPIAWQYYTITHPVVDITPTVVVEELPVATEVPVVTKTPVDVPVAVKPFEVADLLPYEGIQGNFESHWVYIGRRSGEIVAFEQQELNLTDACRKAQLLSLGLYTENLLRVDPYKDEVFDILKSHNLLGEYPSSWGYELNPYCGGVGVVDKSLPYGWERVLLKDGAEGIEFPSGFRVLFYYGENSSYAVPQGKVLIVMEDLLREKYPAILVDPQDLILADDTESTKITDGYLSWETNRAPGNHVRLVYPTQDVDSYPIYVAGIKSPCDGMDSCSWVMRSNPQPAAVFRWPGGVVTHESDDYTTRYMDTFHYQEAPIYWEDFLKSPITAP